MRAARIINWIALLVWLVPFSVLPGYYTKEPVAALIVAPVPLAHLVYCGSSSSWLRWSAVISNALYTLFGVFMVFGTMAGMLAGPDFPIPVPFALALSLCLLVLPGGFNTYALFRERRASVHAS